MDSELQQLLDSPRLPFIARKIDAVLADEATRRQGFYAQISEDDKAEFINGQIIFHSPVKLRHNANTKRLLVLLDAHVTSHDLGYVGYEKIMVSLTRNDYEPDICFFGQAKAAALAPDQMRFPAPDLVVEYWIVDPVTETLEQYRLPEEGDTYELVIKAMTGQVRSVAIPSFEIPVRAIFDPQVNRSALQTILAG